jgi:5-methylcytosine-specific restriction endonuclease McrBC GTP-binding regulatory subunit McrB
LEASRNSHLPYFLILDEMNLARVERYFAPFLSSMESGEALTIHSNPDEVSGVPPSIEWPKNLFIGGTVNMDETTHAFSDKVLDRAFTMEFFDVDLERFFDKRGASDPALRDPDAEKLLLEINEALRPIRRHFGYRAADEVLRFVFKAAAESAESNTLRTDALDQAVLSKVLPRLRGEESESMTKALEAVRSQCKDRELKRCCNKLDQMQDQLRHTGVTGFWS